MDAIVVGIGTVVADDPLLTARPPGPRSATRVVLDSQAQLPLSSRLVQTAAECPVLVAVAIRPTRFDAQSFENSGARSSRFQIRRRFRSLPLLEELARRTMTNVLVEGGGHVDGLVPRRATGRRYRRLHRADRRRW